MNKWLLSLLVVVAFSGLLNAQFVFDRFEVHPDSTYSGVYASVNDTSRVVLTLENSIVHEGSTALRYDWRVQRGESWGGFAKYEMWHPDSMGVWNFSPYENLSIWYYNDVPSSDPSRIHLRIQFFDVSDVALPMPSYDAGQTELWYSFEYVLDDPQGWNQILLPLEDVGAAATNGSNGFWRTGWSGITGNDHLDLDQVKGIGLEISIDAPQDFSVHTGQIIFDYLTFEGYRPLPFIVFNGSIFPTRLGSPFTWGQSSVSVVEGGGIEGTNAIRWVQGDEWGNGYTGWGFNVDPPQFMLGGWMSDSMKFAMKTGSSTGELRLQFESGANGKVGYNFTPITDNQWHDYAFPLRDFVYVEGTTDFDTSAVTVVQILAEGTGVAGNEVFIDYWWTGNPPIDIIPPLAPSPVFVVQETKSNLVTWIDVAGETGETYNVYYSKNPISDVKAEGVDVVDYGIGRPENEQAWSHLLFSPLADSSLTYYYAVTCVDAAGNEGPAATIASPVTNTSKGIGTMALGQVGAGNFAADGNLGEWSGVKELRMFPSEGAHIVTNTTVSGDGDLAVKAYLAADNDYFYFAFDIDDDVLDTTAANSYEKDSPDLFLGLFNFHGAPPGAYGRDDKPHYHFRFLHDRVIEDNLSSVTVITTASADYYWGTKFPIGYVIEGRISWVDIAALAGDEVFVPNNGIRIPLDFSINDADGGGVREGIMTWSPYNDDTSWQGPLYWLYSWVGDKMEGIEDDLTVGVTPLTYDLAQNYPNPFNPSTTIAYQLAGVEDVSLEVFNVLGQKVATLVRQKQSAGKYQVNFDARDLSSGIYFYRLQAGKYVKVHKMILMK